MKKNLSKMSKKIVSYILIAALIIPTVGVSAALTDFSDEESVVFAEEYNYDTASETSASEENESDMDYSDDEEALGRTIIQSGVSGGIKWKLYSDGYLDVKVTGDLPGGESSHWGSDWPWYDYNNSINSAKVYGYGITDTSGMFQYNEHIRSIDMSGLDTSRVKHMNGMFSCCRALKTLKLGAFDTRNVYSMWMMFYGCESLKKIDVSGFDTRNLQGMGSMFLGCYSLEQIDMSNFDLRNVDENDYNIYNATNAIDMFYCSSNLMVIKTPKAVSKEFRMNLPGLYKNKKGQKRSRILDTNDVYRKYASMMRRLYNPNSGEHFYTVNAKEEGTLTENGWNREGVAWYAPVSSKTPVYRLYNPNAGDHHYTVSKQEKNSLVAAGWKYEGIGWYSDDAKGVPLFRLYNPNAKGAGSHHYTTSKSEKNNLVKAGWKYEGIAWYGAK